MTITNISQILIKRGNTTAASNYVGPLGELLIDTGLKTVRVQDGATPGGMATLATESQLANTISAIEGISSIGNIAAILTNIQSANISGITSNVTTLYANVAVQSINISTLFSNANAQASDITTLYANVATQATNINTLNLNVTAANTAIVTANTAMKVYVDAVTTAWTTANTTQSNQIVNLQNQIIGSNAAIVTANAALKGYTDNQITTAINNLIASAPGTLDTLNEIAANLASEASAIGAITNSITNTNANVTAANVNITTLFSNAASQASSLSTLTANAASQSTDITTLYSNAASQATSLNTLTANLGVLYTGNTTTQANIGTIYANLVTQQGNFNTLNANVGAYEIWSNANLATQTTNFNSLATNANANTAAYLTSGVSGNIKTSANVVGTTFMFANGVNILSTVTGTYSNTNVASYLSSGISTGNLTIAGNLIQQSAYYETYGNISNTGGNLTCNFNLGTTFYAALTANVTANFTNVNAVSSTVTGATIIVDQGATAYRVANVQVNGVNQTVKWVGATIGTGTASNTDIMSFSLINLGSGVYRVLGQISHYG